jgi:hypothetical protein
MESGRDRGCRLLTFIQAPFVAEAMAGSLVAEAMAGSQTIQGFRLIRSNGHKGDLRFPGQDRWPT